MMLSDVGGGHHGRRAEESVAVSELLPDLRELATGEVASRWNRLDAVEARRVQPEDLRLALLRELWVAVALLELLRDPERPERLDLRLGRPVEEAVGPPQDVVFADVLQQLAEHVVGLRRRPHQVPPR